MMRRRHSLSARLLGLFLLTAVLLSVVVHFGFRFGVASHFKEMTQPHISEYVSHLLDEIGSPPDPEKAAAVAERLSIVIDIYPHGQLPDLSRFDFHDHRLLRGSDLRVGSYRGEFILLAESGEHTLVFKHLASEGGARLLLSGLATILGVIAVLAFSYHAIQRLFRPVKTIQQGLKRFGEGGLDYRVPVTRKDELGQLAGSVNAMADDIQQMLEAKRQLLFAISHELRSPLTRAKVNLEVMGEHGERETLRRDLDEMEALLQELLESERLNQRHVALDYHAVLPAELIREVIDDFFSDDGIKTQIDQADSYLSLDPMRIRLLIKNLLSNAVKHTPADAPPPEIRSSIVDNAWLFSVQDHGAGIEEKHLAHLTEPFYRADPSRRRETGGFGLGLYLCQMIVNAHEGDMEIHSQKGSGTRVEVRIPLSQQES